MSHQVFIERCRDSNPATAQSLARAIAQRYGVEPQQILGRLGAGRFRVKANLDLASAKRFMEYLEAEGALCSIANDAGEIVARSAEVTPTPPPDLVEDDFLPLYTPPPADGPEMHYESGLSAGFTGASDSQDLGVLADAAAASSGSLTLSTLDGKSSDPKAGPGAGSVADAGDVEAFLPPEMLKETKIELEDEPEPAPPAYEPPVRTPAPQSHVVADEPEFFEAGEPPPEAFSKRATNLLIVSSRGRLALGVLLAFVLGFVVSSTVASGMEKGQYAKAATDLETAYADADSIEAWSELDGVRKSAIGSMERRRRNIVITSLIIWLAVGGLLLFLWLRVINWERVERALSDPHPSAG